MATRTRPIIHEDLVIHEEGVTKLPEAGSRGRYVWATTRMALGFVFLWAFLDKAFALGFATGRQEDGTIDLFAEGGAWLNGGSPTEGFLTFGTKGPFAGFFQGLAGDPWVDWVFMIGLLGIGLALVFGIGMRIATIAGATLLGLMYLATLWPEHNPFIDDHIVYGLVLVGLLMAGAGDTWGMGEAWKRTNLVQRNRWLA